MKEEIEIPQEQFFKISLMFYPSFSCPFRKNLQVFYFAYSLRQGKDLWMFDQAYIVSYILKSQIAPKEKGFLGLLKNGRWISSS
jgi:hypothetical protein